MSHSNNLHIVIFVTEELRRHVKAVLDERRRMVREGYDYNVCQLKNYINYVMTCHALFFIL